jgi:ABC-type glycerol-3-phosphate transport system substrate-binding protein
VKGSFKWLLVVLLMASLISACGGNKGANNESAAGGGSVNESAGSGSETSGGGSEEPAEEEISGTITFLSNRTDMVDKEYVEYARRFSEKYPNAKVEFEAITDHDQGIKLRMSTGELPDVVLIPTIPNSDLPKYFAPLDDLGFNDRIYFPDYKSWDGKLYGISVGAMTTGIVYNKSAFEKAGITKIPTTLDEFLEACEKLKQAGIVPLASNFKDQWPLYPWISEIPISIAANPNLNNERVNTDTPYTMDGPYGQSLQIIRTLYERGYLEPDVASTNWEQSKFDIANGKFAMYLLGNWVIPQVIGAGTTSDNVGFFPFPYDNSGKTNVLLAPDWAYGVNKDSPNLATAKAFVKWMLEESGFETFAGFIPVLKDMEPNVPQLAEFNSFNPTYLEAVPDSPEATEINNRAQITKEVIVQEFVLAPEPEKVLEKYNNMWANAKNSMN